MFRNQYDTDVTVWSPQGNLHQIDYAKEAVKQGSACLGLTSNKLVVLAGIKRLNVKLADHQRKIFKIDDHMGIAISGLTADARTLARFMRTESLNHKFVYGSQITVGRLVSDIADKKQECTQSYIRRPYGVGLLVAGVDKKGVHLYETCPSGNYFEYKANAIGARSQSARTYLEKHFESFPSLGKDELIHHALQAIRGCLQGDQELTSANITVAVVGVDQPFTLIEGDELQPYIDAVEVADVKDEDGDSKMEDIAFIARRVVLWTTVLSMEAKVVAVSGGDERFYTPRSSARRGYSSNGSEDERFASPRETARSVSSEENEYGTPRESLSDDAQHHHPHQSHPNQQYHQYHSTRSTAPTHGGGAGRMNMAELKHTLPDYPPHYYEKDHDDYYAKVTSIKDQPPPPRTRLHASEVRSAQYADAPPPMPENDIFSAARHNRIDSVTYMLDQGVSVNSKDEFGNTILAIACQNGLKRMAKLALRRGANINSQNFRGNTPLHFCFAYGYGESLGGYLISKGADTTVTNNDGYVCYYGIDPPTGMKTGRK
ncbi:TPA: hypothetical protein N0F65_002919 [Lagenidium giganteum]|uniref:Proteasome alpha-type subunits domain-containing protein n=1 Tax=Lagenidium giganteum TaxID=4803 RepID=A0AAV2Z973_9STRA|nr:TPA: hypothetical protein N0F65_002919 [Lagenidium giganteum]